MMSKFISAGFLKNLKKYSVQFLLISALHFYLKLYDRSFAGELFSLAPRSLLFYGLWVGYAFLLWHFSTRYIKHISERFTKKKFGKSAVFMGLAGILPIGYIGSVIFGNLYYLADTQIWGISGWWEDFNGFDLDLNIGYFVFFVLILGLNGTFIFYNDLKSEIIRSEKLKKEFIQSKYLALVNQTDPHFFFNSMSVLGELVYRDADLAQNYIVRLTKLFRYIIDRRDKMTVPLADEIGFLNDYIFLLKIRFEDGMIFETNLDESNQDTYLVTNCLQLPVENAVKHNKFTVDKPLVIRIGETKSEIFVENNLNKRNEDIDSPGLGLENLRNRYALISGKQIRIEETDTTFTVFLPKLGADDIESLNI